MKARRFDMWCVLGVVMFVVGCASLTGGGGGEGPANKIWTYNLQQSLARGGGDVAMTMVLDQGVPKDKAVEAVNDIIKLIQERNLTKAAVLAGLQTLAKKYPQEALLINQVGLIIPNDVGPDVVMPEDVKVLLMSFLKDGALHAADLYKQPLQLKMVRANEAVKPVVK